MTDEQFINEWLRRYRCPWCAKGERPERCAKKNVRPKHEGFWCRSYRCDADRVAREVLA